MSHTQKQLNRLARFDRWTLSVSRFGANVATFALVVIMLTATLDVAWRNLFGRSIPGVIEGAELTLVVGVFLGLAFAQRLKAHVSTSLIADALPWPLGFAVRFLGLLAVIAYIGAATWATGHRAWQSLLSGEVRFGLMEIPQWPARVAISLGFACLVLELIRDLVHMVVDRPFARYGSGPSA